MPGDMPVRFKVRPGSAGPKADAGGGGGGGEPWRGGCEAWRPRWLSAPRPSAPAEPASPGACRPGPWRMLVSSYLAPSPPHSLPTRHVVQGDGVETGLGGSVEMEGEHRRVGFRAGHLWPTSQLSMSRPSPLKL